MKVGEIGDETRDVAAGSLHFDGDRDRVFVVLNAEEDGEAVVGGGVEGLPEFAFAGGAVAEGNVADFVAAELDIFELAVVAGGLGGGVGMAREVASGFGATDGVENLAARG